MEEYLCINGKFVLHKIFPIMVDGACLFRSLSFVMYATDLMSEEVQELIVRHVVENWERFATMSHDKNGNNYSSSALSLRSWGKPSKLLEGPGSSRGSDLLYGHTWCDFSTLGIKIFYWQPASDPTRNFGNLLDKRIIACLFSPVWRHRWAHVPVILACFWRFLKKSPRKTYSKSLHQSDINIKKNWMLTSACGWL